MHLLETSVDPWLSAPARSYHLAVCGERVDVEKAGAGRIWQERPTGKFARSYRLPEDADDSRLEISRSGRYGLRHQSSSCSPGSGSQKLVMKPIA